MIRRSRGALTTVTAVALLVPTVLLVGGAAPARAADPVRPTEDVYTAPEAAPVCRDGICVHYAQDGTNDVPAEDDGAGGTWKGAAGNGVPDLVDQLSVSILPKVAKVFTDAGYRAPLPDGTAGGGHDQIDFYLADLADVEGGASCTAEPAAGQTAPGWCVLDNDYAPAEYGTRLSRSAQLSLDVAHQFFYLVQWAYVDYPDWLAEASASWVEDEIYPTLDRNRAYLPYGPLGNPARSIGGGYPYQAEGAWLFLRYLSERFPAAQGGLPVVVRRIWEHYVPQSDGFDAATEALRPVLADLGTTVIDEITTFSTWNRDPAHHYREGAAYRPAPLQSQVTLGTARRTASFAGSAQVRSSRTFRLRPGSTLTGAWRLSLDARASNSFGATEMAYVATFKARNRPAVTRVIAKGSPVHATVSFAFGAAVEYVDIRVVFGRGVPPGMPDPIWQDFWITAKTARS